jgi:hypothetical protein
LPVNEKGPRKGAFFKWGRDPHRERRVPLAYNAAMVENWHESQGRIDGLAKRFAQVKEFL